MGNARRAGYVIAWWKGDHNPRHLGVKSSAGEKLGRLCITQVRHFDWEDSLAKF